MIARGIVHLIKWFIIAVGYMIGYMFKGAVMLITWIIMSIINWNKKRKRAAERQKRNISS